MIMPHTKLSKPRQEIDNLPAGVAANFIPTVILDRLEIRRPGDP